jgi:hypothetical protein
VIHVAGTNVKGSNGGRPGGAGGGGGAAGECLYLAPSGALPPTHPGRRASARRRRPDRMAGRGGGRQRGPPDHLFRGDHGGGLSGLRASPGGGLPAGNRPRRTAGRDQRGAAPPPAFLPPSTTTIRTSWATPAASPPRKPHLRPGGPASSPPTPEARRRSGRTRRIGAPLLLGGIAGGYGRPDRLRGGPGFSVTAPPPVLPGPLRWATPPSPFWPRTPPTSAR